MNTHTQPSQIKDLTFFYLPGESGGNWHLEGGDTVGTILETTVRQWTTCTGCTQ